jgi:hypothetical protein
VKVESGGRDRGPRLTPRPPFRHAIERYGTIRRKHILRSPAWTKLASAGVCACLAWLPVPASASDGRADSLLPAPGLRLRFGTGRVAGNKPELSPITPDVPEPISSWYVAQWQHRQFLDARTTLDTAQQRRDPELGTPMQAYATPDGTLRLLIYREPKRSELVYELFEQGGLPEAGGGNLFLSTEVPPRAHADFSRPITYELRAKIASAGVTYDSASASPGGTVLAQAFSGFVIDFRAPDGKQAGTLFLQIPISGSHEPQRRYRNCNARGDVLSIVANQSLPQQKLLPFRAASGPLQPMRYLLNAYLLAVLAGPMDCRDEHGRAFGLASVPGALRPGNWTLSGIYVGLESQSQDLHHGLEVPHGSVRIGLQVAGIRMRRDAAYDAPSAPSCPAASCPAP